MTAAFTLLLARFRALGRRERLLVAATTLLAVLTFAQFAYRGVGGAIDGLRDEVVARRAAVAIARQLVTTPAATVGHEPVLTIADRIARSIGLGESLKRLSKDDDGRIRARFEGAAFSTFAHWLGAVQLGSGARIESVLVSRGQQPGRVDITLTLVEP